MKIINQNTKNNLRSITEDKLLKPYNINRSWYRFKLKMFINTYLSVNVKHYCYNKNIIKKSILCVYKEKNLVYKEKTNTLKIRQLQFFLKKFGIQEII